MVSRNVPGGQSAQVPEEEGMMIQSQDQVLKVCNQKPASAVASNSQTAEIVWKQIFVQVKVLQFTSCMILGKPLHSCETNSF